MSAYQDVVNANMPLAAWALVEPSGATFAPFAGAGNLSGSGVSAYQQPGPAGTDLSLTMANGKLMNPSSLFRGPYWCQEAWFNPSGSTSGSNRLLLALGSNMSVSGSAIFLPTTSNVLQLFAGGTGYVLPGTLPVGSWSLVQWGNLSGVNGQVDVALNGVLIASQVVGSFAYTGGIGFGGDQVQATTYAGGIAWPAVYVSQQSALNWASRNTAITDPGTALLQTVTGNVQSVAALDAKLQAILNAVTYRGY